jgi:outer membrane receptor protein involved in Fe transport
VNLGVRFDYGRAGGKFFSDPLDPTNGTTQGTVCIDPARFGLDPSIAQFTDPATGTALTGIAACQNLANRVTIDGQSVTVDSLTKAVAFRDDMGEASIRKAFSPRLGLNFPVTERSSAFFNFGVYYQNPLYNNVYQGTGIGTPVEGTAAGPALANGTFVGNPQLRAEQTTSYEIGYAAEFARNMGLQVVAFSKDQSGLTGIRVGGFLSGTVNRVFDPGVTYGTNSPVYIILVNQDYQTVRGAEIELKRRLADYWKGRLSYAYQQATTNAAPPDLEAQQRDEEGDIEARSEIRSDVDQNHTVNGELTFQVDEQVPSFRFGNLLRNSKITITSRLASGFPYTPTFTFGGGTRDRLERNSGTAPMIFRVDLKAQKDVWVSNVRYGVFMRVLNVFDRKNCLQVFATTGNCDGGASPQARLQSGNATSESEGSTFFDRPQYLDTRRTFNAGVRVTF